MAGVEGAIKKAIYGKKKTTKKDMDIRVDVDSGFKPKPHLDLSSKDLSELKDWEIGKVYDITVKARLTSQSESYDDKGTIRGCFEIQSATDDD